MITKKTFFALAAAATCVAAIGAAEVAQSATFCFPSSTLGTNELPFGNATAQTWGCSVANGGGSASGTGRSQSVSGVKQVCASLISGKDVRSRGLDNFGSAIAGCSITDATANGAFSCDVTGCAAAQLFDVTVSSF